MIFAAATLRTLFTDENVTISKEYVPSTNTQTVSDSEGREIYKRELYNSGKVVLKIGNKITEDMYVIIMDEDQWYILCDNERID